MNLDRFQGHWKQGVGKAKARRGKLTDDDLDVTAACREQLAGSIPEQHGIARDDVERRFTDSASKATDAWFVGDGDRDRRSVFHARRQTGPA